jgi:hypothetical protein
MQSRGDLQDKNKKNPVNPVKDLKVLAHGSLNTYYEYRVH